MQNNYYRPFGLRLKFRLPQLSPHSNAEARRHADIPEQSESKDLPKEKDYADSTGEIIQENSAASEAYSSYEVEECVYNEKDDLYFNLGHEAAGIGECIICNVAEDNMD